ncbi:hypothetical protein COB55_05235 [Candidatus Wolfebacteria bacterium]|nr:MAG: hypothetical protein COB55_05235 [Candidatus Wolfebacteria bacterium]
MANFFKKLFNSVRSGQSVIGIDIGSSAIKIVQLRREKGAAVLETYGTLALGPYAKREIGQATNLSQSQKVEAIKNLMREARVTSKDAGTAIPFSSSLMSLIDMPALDEAELARIVPIEARKYIPVPISEVEFDWWVIPKQNNLPTEYENNKPQTETKEAANFGRVDVLIVAIHKETIANYNAIISKSGMKSSFFEIEVFSAVRSVLEQNLEPVMVVDMGAGATKLYIVESGVVRGSHIINRGSQDLTLSVAQSHNISVAQAEELKRSVGLGISEDGKDLKTVIETALSYMLLESKRILESYGRKHNTVVSKVVLTGGGSVLKGLLGHAQKEFGDTKVVLGDPFSKVETPAFIRGVLTETGPEFAVALGLALRKLQEYDRG